MNQNYRLPDSVNSHSHNQKAFSMSHKQKKEHLTFYQKKIKEDEHVLENNLDSISLTQR